MSEELFDKVNELLKRKLAIYHGGRHKERTAYPLSKKIYCAECGNTYRKKASQNPQWVCREHDIRSAKCHNPQIAEQKVYQAFVGIYNRLVKNKEIILVKMLNELKCLKDHKLSSKYEVHNITEEIAKLTRQILVINKLRTQGYIESPSYYEKLNEINTKISDLTKEKKSLLGKDACDIAIKNTSVILSVIEKNGAISQFEECIFGAIVEKIIAQKNVLTFVLINGIKITAEARA